MAKATKPKTLGRPTGYTDKLADKICTLVAEGNSLRKIVEMPGMPARSSIYKWFKEQQAFSDQYEKAREEQADWYADEIISIADDSSIDPQRARLMVDARKWVASKLKSKAYGDKVQSEQKFIGENGEVVTPSFVFVPVGPNDTTNKD